MTEQSKHSITDLRKMLAEKREALRVFRFGGSGGKAKNVKEGVNLRRTIARILTEINARASHSA